VNEDYHKEYYQKNKERMKQQHSMYYMAHREEILDRYHKRREADPDEAKRKWREYYQKNKLRIKMKRDLKKEQDCVKDV
jgi:hypothetical protein